jgi:peptidyl-tRNA hydrolase
MNNTPIFYLIINSDLQMSRGQINAQLVHITQIIVEECVKMSYEFQSPSKELMDYMKWKILPTTIILKANTTQLKELIKLKNCRGFYDSGNRIKDESLTVVGFLPSDNLNEIVKDFKLY